MLKTGNPSLLARNRLKKKPDSPRGHYHDEEAQENKGDVLDQFQKSNSHAFPEFDCVRSFGEEIAFDDSDEERETDDCQQEQKDLNKAKCY